MPVISERDFFNKLESNNISGLFFIFGEEKYLVKDCTKKLEKSVLSDGVNNFNFEIFNEFNFNLDKIQNFIDVLPFCCERKLLKIVDLKPNLLGKSELEQLKDVLKNLPNYLTVVITQTSEEVNLKSGHWFSVYKFFEKYGYVLKLNKLNKANLKKLAENWFKDKNINIKPECIDSLIDICPNGLENLTTELEKISAYSLSKEITNDCIEKITFESKEANVFELTKAIANFDLFKFLEKLNYLILKKEEPIFILNIISSFYIDVYRVKLSITHNKNKSNLLSFFDYKNKAFKLEIAKKYANNFTLEQIKENLKKIAQTDYKMKTTNLNKQFLLEKLIVSILLV